MSKSIVFTQDDVTFTLKKKYGQKHTYIRIKPDGSVVVTTGYLTPNRMILAFVAQKSSWIKAQQKKSKTRPLFQHNATKEQAQALILPLVEKYARIMKCTPSFVGFRKNRTRWGSCSSKNRLNFNTNLVEMPLAFVEYVVVHELAHIKHKNHSQAFWAEVQKYLPDYKTRQKLSISLS